MCLRVCKLRHNAIHNNRKIVQKKWLECMRVSMCACMQLSDIKMWFEIREAIFNTSIKTLDMPIIEFLLRQHNEYQNDKKSSENKCTSLYSFDRADGTEIWLKPAVSSLRVWLFGNSTLSLFMRIIYSANSIQFFVYFYSIRMRQIQSVFLKTIIQDCFTFVFTKNREKLWTAKGEKNSVLCR